MILASQSSPADQNKSGGEGCVRGLWWEVGCLCIFLNKGFILILLWYVLLSVRAALPPHTWGHLASFASKHQTKQLCWTCSIKCCIYIPDFYCDSNASLALTCQGTDSYSPGKFHQSLSWTGAIPLAAWHCDIPVASHPFPHGEEAEVWERRGPGLGAPGESGQAPTGMLDSC